MQAIHFLRAFVLCGLLAVASTAGAAPFDTTAEYAFLYDAGAHAILFEKNADKLMAPASMSKLMTLEVVFDRLKKGDLTLEQQFTVSEHAWRTGGAVSGTSSIIVPLNAKLTLADIIPGIIVQSGNDACIVIAEGVAGSEDAFARMMTEEARKLGLARSTFTNSTGLPDPKNLVTARELALLARHLMETYPDYYRYFSQKAFEFRGKKFLNKNPLLALNIGADGLKTGFTDQSGYGLVGSSLVNGRRLIVVINGTKSEAERSAETKRLLQWGYDNFQEAEIFAADEEVGKARVWGGTRFYVPLIGNGPIKILVPRFATDNKLKAEIVYQGPLKPPIRRGDRVAILRVANSEGGTTEVPLVAGADADPGSIFVRGFDSLMTLAFRWVPL